MVDIFRWNPPLRPKYFGSIARYTPSRIRLNNFGDLLGPIVVAKLAEKHGVSDIARGKGRLISVGSVLHFAKNGDVVWGTGLNGKMGTQRHAWTHLDVRAVRGPRTAQFLEERGIIAPKIYGDPALLLPDLVPQLRDWASQPKQFGTTVVPNYNDYAQSAAIGVRPEQILCPTSPVFTCLERIARSEFVTGSSLHAIVVAESLGIPARVMRSRHETELKYLDYFEGTGRFGVEIADTYEAAVDLGGAPRIRWDSKGLVDAFPLDLWSPD